MKAAIYTRYGGPEVVSLAEVPRPAARKGEIVVAVGAAAVTTGDWRLRAAAFPGGFNTIAGRLMFGIFRPRKPILGSAYAGTVVEVGPGVTEFAPGDRVFGFAWGGAHADYLAVKASGAVAPTPAGLGDAEAAALPFGAMCALDYLERYTALKPGERLLVVGASGGVGAYAVQVGRALGAHVTGISSAASADFVRAQGADAVVDYTRTDPARLAGPYDVVFDTIGTFDYPAVAPMLAPGGRFAPLNFLLVDLRHARRARARGHRQVLRVNGDSKAGLMRLSAMVAAGKLRGVVDKVYPLSEIRAAYADVESRRRKGVVVVVPPAAAGTAQPELRAVG